MIGHQMSLWTSRTPLRVSFFGGGTDYPEYFSRYRGAVLGCAIDQHIYISALRMERFIGYAYRLSYRIIEEVNEHDEIEHPVFREVFKWLKLDKGWNFGVLSSLPARSGLGSSSSFTVGLLNLLSHIQGLNYTRHDLARTAINVERDILRENVGIQDQIHAAYGSLNRYEFHRDEFSIHPIRLHGPTRDAINSSLFLVYTGNQRYASEVVREQIEKTKDSKIDRELSHLYDLTIAGQQAFELSDPEAALTEVGRLLRDAWKTKRGLTKSVSSPTIDEIYDTAMDCGALGGKLCGAGGGGFFLLLVPNHCRERLQERLGDRRLVPIRMDEIGSTVYRT